MKATQKLSAIYLITPQKHQKAGCWLTDISEEEIESVGGSKKENKCQETTAGKNTLLRGEEIDMDTCRKICRKRQERRSIQRRKETHRKTQHHRQNEAGEIGGDDRTLLLISTQIAYYSKDR